MCKYCSQIIINDNHSNSNTSNMHDSFNSIKPNYSSIEVAKLEIIIDTLKKFINCKIKEADNRNFGEIK